MDLLCRVILPTARATRNAVTDVPLLYTFASQDGGSFHILPLILIYYQCNGVNVHSLLVKTQI